MNFLNSNDSKGERLSSGALLVAVALHATVLWGLIVLPQPPARPPEVLEFTLLEPTAQLEQAESRPRPASAQPPRAVPTATEPKPRRTEQAQTFAPAQAAPAVRITKNITKKTVAPAQVAPAARITKNITKKTVAPAVSSKSKAASTAVADAPPVTVAESSPEFAAAYLRNITPLYPALSRRLREEGRVMLQVRVNPQGQPVSVAVHASSGFKRLDNAAREAVEGWRFVPARRGPIPIEATVLVPLVFKLES